MRRIFLIKLFVIVFFNSIVCFCDRDGGLPMPPAQIYKLKRDYIDKVCVGLTEDKSQILCYPGPGDNCGNPDKKPIKVKSDYYLDVCCTYGHNSAYLSIKKEDYHEYIPVDSMYKLILDKYPYEEYYVDYNRILEKSCTECFALDTALLNNIITENKLEEYFKKLI